jgi:hypothetical protein
VDEVRVIRTFSFPVAPPCEATPPARGIGRLGQVPHLGAALAVHLSPSRQLGPWGRQSRKQSRLGAFPPAVRLLFSMSEAARHTPYREPVGESHLHAPTHHNLLYAPLLAWPAISISTSLLPQAIVVTVYPALWLPRLATINPAACLGLTTRELLDGCLASRRSPCAPPPADVKRNATYPAASSAEPPNASNARLRLARPAETLSCPVPYRHRQQPARKMPPAPSRAHDKGQPNERLEWRAGARRSPCPPTDQTQLLRTHRASWTSHEVLCGWATLRQFARVYSVPAAELDLPRQLQPLSGGTIRAQMPRPGDRRPTHPVHARSVMRLVSRLMAAD